MRDACDHWEELDVLLDGVLDGIESKEDVRRLNEILRTHPEAWRRFVSYMSLHGRLVWGEGLVEEGVVAHAQNAAAEMTDDTLPKKQPAADAAPPIHPSSFVVHPFNFLESAVLCYAVAGLLLAVGTLAAWSWTAPGGSRQSVRAITPPAPLGSTGPDGKAHQSSVAKITGTSNCRWVGPDVVRDLAAGKVALTSGLLEITYKSGAKVLIEGPAAYQIDSDHSGFLLSGKLAVRVDAGTHPTLVNGHQGLGCLLLDAKAAPRLVTGSGRNPATEQAAPNEQLLFCVRTRFAIAIDIGEAEFGVEADPSALSQVSVLKGRVLLKFPAVPGKAYLMDEANVAQVCVGPGVGGSGVTFAFGVKNSAGPEFARRLPKDALFYSKDGGDKSRPRSSPGT